MPQMHLPAGFKGRWRYPALLAAAALLVAPIWMVRFPPLTDYPNHLARYFILAHLHDPRFRFEQFYASNWKPFPYVAVDLLAVGLQSVLPIYAAGKVILSLCVLIVPLAVWSFLREANPGNLWLVPCSGLLCYNQLFLTGLVNNQLGFALCILTLAVWLRYLREPHGLRWGVFVIAVSSIYFVHGFSFAMAGFVVLLYSALRRISLRIFLASGVAFLPPLLVSAINYAYAGENIHSTYAMHFESLRSKAGLLFAPVLGYSHIFNRVVFLAILAGVILSWWKNPDFRINRPWLGVSLGVFLLYILAPIHVGTAFLFERRIIQFFFVLILAAAQAGRRARVLGAVFAFLVILQAPAVAQNFIQTQPLLNELSQRIEAVPRNARVFVMLHSHTAGTPIFRLPFYHHWAYGVIDRGWLSPFVFHDPGVHPLRMIHPVYCQSPRCDSEVSTEPDWRRVQADYDFVWSYHASPYTRQILPFADPLLSQGDLQVYHLKNQGSGQNINAGL